AMGGFICATSAVVELLKQRARPYLFSNALAPAVCGSSLEAIRISASADGDALRTQLFANAGRFRGAMAQAGFDLLPGEHPIIPVMLGDAKLAQTMAARMLELGVYVIGFSFPVVPRGQARIRTQMSAAHTFEQIDHAVAAFTKAGRELGVIA
ncbi:MAG: aminotransferase class I/II-fold pyridoxal phosphate-dependent enzyme, partial [Brevundimonas sp.]